MMCLLNSSQNAGQAIVPGAPANIPLTRESAPRIFELYASMYREQQQASWRALEQFNRTATQYFNAVPAAENNQ